MSDEIVDKLPPIFELLRLLFGYRFHGRACRRLIVFRRDSESNQNWDEYRRDLLNQSFPHFVGLRVGVAR